MGPWMAAAQTKTWTPPKSRRMRSTAALTCSKSVTSVRMRSALPPACSISKCARSNSALLRASNPTLAPAAANPRASRLPIPRPAPVTSTPALVRECTCLPIYGSTEKAGLGIRDWGLGAALTVGLLFVHRLIGSVEELFRRFVGDSFCYSYRDADVYGNWGV